MNERNLTYKIEWADGDVTTIKCGYVKVSENGTLTFGCKHGDDWLILLVAQAKHYVTAALEE